jgi:hypothetical protein
MNHIQSIATNAAERYLTDELLPGERDAFERHYFECPECAGDVWAGSLLANSAREFFRRSPVAEPARIRRMEGSKWRSWFTFPSGLPVAAALALLTFTVYQNAMVIPGLRNAGAETVRMQVLPFAVLVPPSRSTFASVIVPVSAHFLQLSLELPPATVSGAYDCDLRDETGRSLWKVPVSVDDTAGPISLLIPTGRLAAGSYQLVLKSRDRRDARDVDHFRFRLSRR